MKKFIFGLIFSLVGIVSMSAQTYTVDNGRTFDNIYVGASVGDNVWNSSDSWSMFKANPGLSWWQTRKPSVKLYVGKYFTPYVGAEVDYNLGFYKYGKFIDAHYLGGNGVINLSNVIWGYNGKTRPVYFELIPGLGWSHDYNVKGNSLYVKGGLRTNIKLTKNLGITVTPEYMYMPKAFDNPSRHQAVNLYAGIKYTIPSKRSGFTKVRAYNQAEIDSLNAKINHLQRALAHNTRPITPRPRPEAKAAFVSVPNTYSVKFEQGKSEVADITGIVDKVKKLNKKITIIGTTSPEGSEDLNRDLGQARANAVKDALVKAGINPDLITIKSDYSDLRNALIIVE